MSIGASSSIISTEDIPNRTENNRSNSFLSSNINNRLSLPNVDHIQQLKREVDKLKRELNHTQESHRQKTEQLVREEQDIRNENLRLQLCRQLSERTNESFVETTQNEFISTTFNTFTNCFKSIIK